MYNAPGDSKRGPECKHGGTATKAVTFRTCVQAIRDSGFTASPYPVIITIENHTEGRHQVDMVNILKEELKEALFIPPREPQVRRRGPFPTPHRVTSMPVPSTSLHRSSG